MRKDIGCKYICRDFKRYCRENSDELIAILEDKAQDTFEGDLEPLALMMYLNERFVIKHTLENLVCKKAYSRLMRLGKSFDTVSKSFSIGVLRKLLRSDSLIKALTLYSASIENRWTSQKYSSEFKDRL